MSEIEKQILNNQLCLMRLFADTNKISVYHEQQLLNEIMHTNVILEKHEN